MQRVGEKILQNREWKDIGCGGTGDPMSLIVSLWEPLGPIKVYDQGPQHFHTLGTQFPPKVIDMTRTILFHPLLSLILNSERWVWAFCTVCFHILGRWMVVTRALQKAQRKFCRGPRSIIWRLFWQQCHCLQSFSTCHAPSMPASSKFPKTDPYRYIEWGFNSLSGNILCFSKFYPEKHHSQTEFRHHCQRRAAHTITQRDSAQGQPHMKETSSSSLPVHSWA